MTLALLFVGDGETDAVAVPSIVARLLNKPVRSQFEAWARLHRRGSGRGLNRKLKYAMRQAIDRSLQGVVATLDADQSTRSDKLKELLAARDEERARGNAMPCVLGEAIPHLEAWIIDDPVAVRLVLELESSTVIPAPSKVESPKDELHILFASSTCGKDMLVVLQEIAASIETSRCNLSDQTGFSDFCKEVERELRPLCRGIDGV